MRADRTSRRVGPDRTDRTYFRNERLFASVGAVALTSPFAPVLSGFEAAPAASPTAPRQQSLDDLGTPLSEVTFVVVDLETTGASPRTDAITEIGAVQAARRRTARHVRDAREPGRADPADDHRAHRHHRGDGPARAADRRGAARVPRVRARRGDRRPQHPLRRLASSTPRSSRTATRGSRTGGSTRVALARRLVRDEVPNLRLSTLARHFRTAAEPSHRAYADAAATAEVLHALLERAAALRRARPRRPARAPDDARAPVGGQARAHDEAPARTGRLPLPRPRRTGPLRRQGDQPARARALVLLDRRPAQGAAAPPRDGTHRAPGVPRARSRPRCASCASSSGSNRASTGRSKSKRALRVPEAHRRAVPAPRRHRASPRADGASYLGPFRSSAAAHRAREAIEAAVPLRRCGTRIGRKADDRERPAVRARPARRRDVPVPRPGRRAEYRSCVDTVRRGLRDDPSLLCAPLEARMHAPGRGRAIRGGGGDARPARDARAARCNGSARSDASARAPNGSTLDTDEGPRRARARPGRARRERGARRSSRPRRPAVDRGRRRAHADTSLAHATRRVRCVGATAIAASRLPAVASYARGRDD